MPFPRRHLTIALFSPSLSLPLSLALMGLTACVPGATQGYSSAPPNGLTAGQAPASGRTNAERQMRKDYYRGPRGNEF